MDNKQIRIKILSSEGIIDEKNKTLTVFYDSNSWSRYNDFKRDLRAAAKNQDDSMLIDADNALKEHGYEVDTTKKHKLNLNTPEAVTYNIKKTEMKVGGKLIGNQSKLDLNKNGKLDSNDFKMLRNKKGNGGGTGVSSETGYAVGTNSDLLMNQDYLAYKKGGGVSNFKIGDVVYNKKQKTIGIVRDIFDRNDLRTDADGVVDMDILEIYNKSNPKHQKAQIANSTRMELGSKYTNGGSLADTPESFPSTDAMSYGDGGSTSGWCYSIGGL
jgi:hypothetical protein